MEECRHDLTCLTSDLTCLTSDLTSLSLSLSLSLWSMSMSKYQPRSLCSVSILDSRHDYRATNHCSLLLTTDCSQITAHKSLLTTNC